MNPSVNDVMELRSDVAYLEFSIWTSSIFIDLFMNKEMKLSSTNIDAIETNMRDSLKYVTDWYTYFKAQMSKSKQREENKMCLSKIAYSNLRVGIVGFIAYVRLVLQVRGVKYVPMLHSSSSSIEAAFSQIRMHPGDDPANISRVLHRRKKNNELTECK
jgi:hypothetical protein